MSPTGFANLLLNYLTILIIFIIENYTNLEKYYPK